MRTATALGCALLAAALAACGGKPLAETVVSNMESARAADTEISIRHKLPSLDEGPWGRAFERIAANEPGARKRFFGHTVRQIIDGQRAEDQQVADAQRAAAAQQQAEADRVERVRLAAVALARNLSFSLAGREITPDGQVDVLIDVTNRGYDAIDGLAAKIVLAKPDHFGTGEDKRFEPWPDFRDNLVYEGTLGAGQTIRLRTEPTTVTGLDDFRDEATWHSMNLRASVSTVTPHAGQPVKLAQG